MPVEITIKVTDTSQEWTHCARKYNLDYLLSIPQGHIQIWNDMIAMIEEIQSFKHIQPPDNE